MAEVDHVMLARFACVEADGSLTVVGGHRSVFEVAGLPGQHVLCVAGRLLVARREPPPVLSLGALTPAGEVPDVATWPVGVPSERGVGGRLPVAFAVTLVAPAPCAGAYALVLSVNGDVVRTLAFTVVDTLVVPAGESGEGGRGSGADDVPGARGEDVPLTDRRSPG